MIRSAKSLGDMFFKNCEKFAHKALFLVPGKGGHKPVSFGEAKELVRPIAADLRHRGLKQGDAVALVCETCVEWALVDWACQTLGLVLVPIYPTLPADQAQYIASDCGAKLVVAQDEKQAAKFPGVEILVIKGTNWGSDSPRLDDDEWVEACRQVQLDDIATIIYTSGTTGQPKGAMLTHRGFLSLSADLYESHGIDDTDLFLSFLPLSHVFERFAGHFLAFSVGASIAYVGSLASLAHDLANVKPTIMCSVPRFFENMRSRILDAVDKGPAMKRRLFHLALNQGVARAKGRFAPLYSLTDRLVGKTVRSKTGGKIKFFVSGGAALAPTVSEFYLAFGINILQGYGLTETTAASSLNLPDDNRPWTVGVPVKCVETKIASDGEILVRGPSVMKGYFNLPDDTAAAIDSEGWFHTGDIGEFEGPNLKITDRKKDLIVLANGKNIAPQKIESALKESPMIAEAVLFGDGMEHCVALLVPNFERLEAWAAEHGLDREVVLDSDETKSLFKAEVAAVNQTLADFERVKKQAVLSEPFSIEGGELTPSMKVKRKVVREKYKQVLVSLGLDA